MSELSKKELVELVQSIMDCVGTEEEVERNFRRFEHAVPHPEPSYYFADTSRNWTAEEIVDACLSYTPTALGPSGSTGVEPR